VNRKIFVFVLTALTGLFVYTSCTKLDTTDLGSELIPVVDNIHTFEAILDVETNNFPYGDTTRLSNSFLHALGIIQDDPEFGRTQANMYLSLTPAVYGTHPFAVQDSIVVDSVVLSLAYGTLYGDSTSIQKVEVFQIDPTGNFKDSVFHINEPDFALLPATLGSKDVDFTTLNDSVYYTVSNDTVRTASELRIKLDTAFARQFINYDTANQYKSDSAFTIYFKGLAVKINDGASAGKRALAYFDVTNTDRTKLTFYTRSINNGVTDTGATVFSYGGGAQANLIRRTPAHNYLAYLNNGTPSDDKVYIQSTPGSYATVKIPGLDTFKNVNRVIHRAELIVEQTPSALDNIYTPPPFLFVDAINAAGDSAFTIRNDFIPTTDGSGYDVSSIGGVYSSNKYIFTLTRYLQSVVTKKQPYYTLRIYAPLYVSPYYQQSNMVSVKLPFLYVNEPVSYGRLVAGGGSATSQKMRIRIIYSKI
jgi:hypothetical protein